VQIVSSFCMDHSLGKDFKLKCISTNARCITSKFAEFQVLIDQQLPHVIAISESWCSSSISNTEIQLEGYTLIDHVLLVKEFYCMCMNHCLQ